MPPVPRAKHGLSRHPLYSTWTGMLSRCENPRNSRYRGYGGRGITVCPEWHDPVVFITWIEQNLGPRPAGRTPGGRPAYTLNRVDNNGHYEPGNVEWADWKRQTLNRRSWRWEFPRRPRPQRLVGNGSFAARGS